jgi:hypothetical protein
MAASGIAGHTLTFIDTDHAAPEARERLAASFPERVSALRRFRCATSWCAWAARGVPAAGAGVMNHVRTSSRPDLRRYPLLLASSVLVTIASTVVAASRRHCPWIPRPGHRRPSRRTLLDRVGGADSHGRRLIVQIHPLVAASLLDDRPIPALALLADKLIVLSIVVSSFRSRGVG